MRMENKFQVVRQEKLVREIEINLNKEDFYRLLNNCKILFAKFNERYMF